MKPWKTLSRRTVFQGNRFLSVEHHEVQLPNGRVINDWTWVKLPEYACILARTGENTFLYFRQTKYAFPDPVLAPPGGYLEPGELPLDGAKRELLEETGYASGNWHNLGSFIIDSNRGAGKAHLFLALDAHRTAAPIPEDLEEQHLILMSRHELEAQLDRGEVPLASWVALLTLGLRRLDSLEKKHA